MMHALVSLPAGTHTVKVQWRLNAATGDIWACHMNSSRHLTVIEL